MGNGVFPSPFLPPLLQPQPLQKYHKKASLHKWGFFYCASAMQAMLSSLHPELRICLPHASRVAPVVITSSTRSTRLFSTVVLSLTENASSTFSHRSTLVFRV